MKVYTITVSTNGQGEHEFLSIFAHITPTKEGTACGLPVDPGAINRLGEFTQIVRADIENGTTPCRIVLENDQANESVLLLLINESGELPDIRELGGPSLVVCRQAERAEALAVLKPGQALELNNLRVTHEGGGQFHTNGT